MTAAAQKMGILAVGSAGPESTEVEAMLPADVQAGVDELRLAVRRLSQDTRSQRERQEVVRQLHALGVVARGRGLSTFAGRLRAVEAELDRVGPTRPVGVALLNRLDATLQGGLLELSPQPPESVAAPQAGPAEPLVALVIGADRWAAALSGPSPAGDFIPFEVEQQASLDGGLFRVRALAPDLLVVDADLPETIGFLRDLSSDALLQDIPVVLVSDPARHEHAARWLGRGASAVVNKPPAPESLWNGSLEALDRGPRPFLSGQPGEYTLEMIADQLCGEVRRALLAGVEGPSAQLTVESPSEVVAPLWTSLREVQTHLTRVSKGRWKFQTKGPERALPPLPSRMRRRRSGVVSRPATGPDLHAISVVIVDDDPAMTWFMAEVLRSKGALVQEAHSGEAALSLCLQSRPDLLICDALLPDVGGLALSRSVKLDVAISDTAVVMLSWKEELCQRMKELGAPVDEYLLKDSDPEEILTVLQDVLAPRMGLRRRLANVGEVRGRVEGLSPVTLLTLLAQVRPDCSVTVEDAAYVFEVEMRGGRPVSASRTRADGEFCRGMVALQTLLGMRSGRFVVHASERPCKARLQGSLDEQLLGPVASARAASLLVTQAASSSVAAIEFDEAAMEPYWQVSPNHLRQALEAVAAGAPPATALEGGKVVVNEWQAALLDAAWRGAVIEVRQADGAGQMTAAVAQERARMLEEVPMVGPLADPLQSPLPPDELLAGLALSATPAPVSVGPSATGVEPQTEEHGDFGGPIAPTKPVVLATAPAPGPGSDSANVAEVAEPGERSEQAELILLEESYHAPGVDEADASDPHADLGLDGSDQALVPSLKPPSARDDQGLFDGGLEFPTEEPPALSDEESPLPEGVSAPPRQSGVGMTVLGVVAAAALVGGLSSWYVGERPVVHKAPEAAAQPKRAEPRRPAEPRSPHETPKAINPGAPDPLAGPKTLPLPAGVQLAPGQGMVEIIAGKYDEIFLDKAALGKGPRAVKAVTPGGHDVRIRREGEEQPRMIYVREGRMTRVDLRSPWKR